MEKFNIYQKQAKGRPFISVADLIPIGRENAIKRKELLNRCIGAGLVSDNNNADRAMRNLIRKDRKDFVILNLSNGGGYYRPSREDIQDLQRYIRQEESRGKATFNNIKLARALYEDYKHERVDGGD